jgi:hypothetical protein
VEGCSMASRTDPTHRVLSALAAVGVAFVLTVVGLVGLGANDARPDGSAVASADEQPCGTDGGDGGVGQDCEDDGDGGDGGDDGGGSGPPENGEWTSYISTVDCHFPEGEIDRSTTGGIDYACGEEEQPENCAEDTPGGRFTWYWRRSETYAGGERVDVGPWQFYDLGCVGPAEPTQEQVRESIFELLPKGKVEIQPPDGRTPVSWPTNFIADTGDQIPFVHSDNLAGFDVSFSATPTHYTWDFGDGETLPTDKPGRPYPNLDVTHEYTEVDVYQVSVDVEWTVTYQINGGPERQLDEPVSVVDGPTEPLRVVELQSLLGAD